MVCARAKTRGEERRPQSYELDGTTWHTMGTPKEDVETAYQRCREVGGGVTVDMALDRMEWRRGTVNTHQSLSYKSTLLETELALDQLYLVAIDAITAEVCKDKSLNCMINSYSYFNSCNDHRCCHSSPPQKTSLSVFH